MNATTIGLIITIVIAWILVYSTLIGFKRGLGKTFFRFCWLFVTCLILIFTTPLLSNWLNSYDLSSLNIDIAGPVTKLSDIGLNLLNSLNLDPSISQSSSVVSFAENFPIMILNVLLFVLLFWLLKWILYPIFALISSRIFDKDKITRKKYNKRVKNYKKKGMPVQEEAPINVVVTNKHRGLGALLGFIIGALICMVTFTPIVGINNLYQNVYANVVVENEDGSTSPYLEQVVQDEQVLEYANSYELSFGKNILDYSGMSFISNLMFDRLAVIKVNDSKVNLANEVNCGISFYNSYLKVNEFLQNSENVTKQSFDKFLTDVKELVYKINNSQLIYTIGNEVLPKLADKYILENEDFSIKIGQNDYTQLVKDAYEKSTKNNPLNVKNAQKQIDSLINVTVLLNNNDIAIALYKGEITTINEVINLLADGITNIDSFSSSLVDNLYKIDLLKDEYSKIIDDFIRELFENEKIGNFVSNQQVINSTLQSNSKIIVENLLVFLKNYNNSTNFDFGLNTRETLESAGKILDSAKSCLLSEESYISLIDYFKEFVNEKVTNSFADLSIVINKISSISNWQTELRSLSSLYEAIIDIVNSDENFSFDSVLNGQNKTINSLIYNVGDAIQVVVSSKNSTILTNENIREVVSALFNKLENDGNVDQNIKDLLNLEVDSKMLKNIVLDNIWSQNTSQISNWGNEVKYTLEFVSKINKTITNFDKDRFAMEGNTELEDFGKSIDNALRNTKLIINSKVLRAFFEQFILNDENILGSGVQEVLNIQIAKPDGVSGTISVKEYMLNNIYNPNNNKSDVSSWKQELFNLKPLLTGTFDTNDLEGVGLILDNLYSSQILERDIVKKIICHYIDEETSTITDVDITQPVAIMNNLILEDKDFDDESLRIKYAVEFKNLLDLLDVINADYTDSGGYTAQENKLIQIGMQFDILCGDNETFATSKILTKNVINAFLNVYLDKFITENVTDPDLNFIQTTIQNNLINIQDYSLEIQSIIDLSKTIKETDYILLGRQLDSIKNRGSVLVNALLQDLVSHFINEKLNNYATGKYSSSISLIKANLQANTIESYENEFSYIDQFYKLVLSSSNIQLTGENGLGNLLNEVVKNSNLITKQVIDNLLQTVLTDEINSLSITENLRIKLKAIISNVPNIQNYETEFDYLNKITTAIDTSSVDKDALATILDEIKGNSLLITKTNIDEIIKYYFEDETKNYNADYKDIIQSITDNIPNVDSYSGLFNEIRTLKSTIDKIVAIQTLDNFIDYNLGIELDNIAQLENINGQNTSYEVTKIMINKVKNIENNQTMNDEIDDLLESPKYDFNNNNTPQWTTGYYESLVGEIITIIKSI